MKIEPLSQAHAMEIAKAWHYPEPYDFYDMENDSEDYEEIISPAARGDRYYQVIKNDELYGFFCIFPQGDSKLELGLGLKPEYCGQGQGAAFLQEILDFVEQRFAVQAVSLSVAAFNKRAQQLYRKCGFEIVSQREQESNGSVHLFLQMEKKCIKKHI